MTIGEVQQLGAYEFDRWQAYWSREPWGAWRDNMHAGLIASTIRNALRRKGAKPVEPADFMLMTQADRRAKSMNWLRSLVTAAKDKKRNG